MEEKPPNPMAGMTDEQKEHEAMRLVNMLDKLSRCVLSLEEHPGHSRGGGQCCVHYRWKLRPMEETVSRLIAPR